jgi:hypothetical protein
MGAKVVFYFCKNLTEIKYRVIIISVKCGKYSAA